MPEQLSVYQIPVEKYRLEPNNSIVEQAPFPLLFS